MGDSVELCIVGVWILVLCDINSVGSIILIDIEGINFGNNENIDLLSIFMVFLFLGLVFFVREVL